MTAELKYKRKNRYRNMVVQFVVASQSNSAWQTANKLLLSHNVQVPVRQHLEMDCFRGAYFRHLTSEGGRYLVLSDFWGHLREMLVIIETT